MWAEGKSQEGGEGGGGREIVISTEFGPNEKSNYQKDTAFRCKALMTSERETTILMRVSSSVPAPFMLAYSLEKKGGAVIINLL